MVVLSSNLSYLSRKDRRVEVKANSDKKSVRSCLKNKLGRVASFCNPSYLGSEGRNVRV
jgi:hypothetical protein